MVILARNIRHTGEKSYDFTLSPPLPILKLLLRECYCRKYAKLKIVNGIGGVEHKSAAQDYFIMVLGHMCVADLSLARTEV
jgi:hypothetical protein